MVVEPFAQEKPGEGAESRRLARASFLRLIPEMRPECIKDLSSTVFFEFVLVVCERFKNELMKGTRSGAKSGAEVFASLFIRALRRCGDDSFMNKGIGDVLCRTFAGLDVIGSQALEQALPSFRRIKRLKYSTRFCALLEAWSVKWNLDSDWCREHAFTALRDCLADEYLKWSLLDDDTPIFKILNEARSNTAGPKADQIALFSVYSHAIDVLSKYPVRPIWGAWNYSPFSEITSEVYWSRVELSLQVYGGRGYPEEFRFKWKQLEFVRAGYDALRESKSRYKKRMDLEFRLYLNEHERLELLDLLKVLGSGNSTTGLQFSSRRVLQKFNKELDGHVRSVLRKTEKTRRGLVKVKKRPKLEQHLRWAVEHQVSPGKALSDIAVAYDKDVSNVSRAVNDCLTLIGLRKRPDAKRGRRWGQRNRYDKHLRELGR